MTDDVPISALPAIEAPTSAALIVAVQDGVTGSLTMLQTFNAIMAGFGSEALIIQAPNDTGISVIVQGADGTAANDGASVAIRGGDTFGSGAGGAVEVRPGDATGSGSGANLLLRGGDIGSNNPAVAGSLIMRAGGNNDGAHGAVLLQGLPTTDPHNADQLWNNLGVLTISAG
jgi:hypothetical protein